MCLKCQTLPLKNDGKLDGDLSSGRNCLFIWLVQPEHFAGGKLVFMIRKAPHLGGSETEAHDLIPRAPGLQAQLFCRAPSSEYPEHFKV